MNLGHFRCHWWVEVLQISITKMFCKYGHIFHSYLSRFVLTSACAVVRFIINYISFDVVHGKWKSVLYFARKKCKSLGWNSAKLARTTIGFDVIMACHQSSSVLRKFPFCNTSFVVECERLLFCKILTRAIVFSFFIRFPVAVKP